LERDLHGGKIAARMPSTSPLDGPPARADWLAGERELLAGLSLLYFRDLKLASLRWSAAASFPLWLEAESGRLPGSLVWLALLAQAFCLVLAAGYAAVERRWTRRADRLEPNPAAAAIHAAWTDWDELRAALWYGMAIVSLILWTYVGLGRRMPATLLSALTAAGATLFLLVVVAETARLRAALRRRAAGGSGAPPRSQFGHGQAR
jgi:hypothetical protein